MQILLFMHKQCAHQHTCTVQDIKVQDSVLGLCGAMDRLSNAKSDMIHDLYETNHFTGASESGVACAWVSFRNITSLK
jgi:hypothetical protein